MTDTILLLLDGSDRGARAGEYTLDRAEREDAVVHALSVVDTARYGEPALSSAEIVVDDAEDRAHDRLSSFAARAAERGIPVETTCCHGDPAEELVATAGAVEADVAVFTRRIPHTARTRLETTVDTVVTELEEPAVA